MKRHYFAAALLLCFAASAAAQIPETRTSGGAFPEPKGEFAGIRMGDDIGGVKKSLLGSPYFSFRGDRDVSFLPKRPETVIDCEGTFHVLRGLFQFHGDRLYIMTLYLNPARTDYYSLFTRLSQKYGPPAALDPSGAAWESDSLRLSLEKPLTVKYVGREIFEKVRAAGTAEKSAEELSRARFLELF